MYNPNQILFCADDAALLAGLTRFIAAALDEGNPAIVWATESHRDALIQRLRTWGVRLRRDSKRDLHRVGCR